MSASGAAVSALFALGIVVLAAGRVRPRATRRPGGGVPWRRLVPWMGLCALGAGLAVLAVTAVPAAALVVAAFAGALPVMRHRRAADRQRTAARAAWPDAIDVLAAGVRAGQGVPDCIGDLSRTGPVELRSVFAAADAELRASGDFRTSMAALSEAAGDPVAGRVASALLLARELGGRDLGALLRSVSAFLRQDARLQAEIKGRHSWTVSAARMAVAAPWLTLALLCTRPEAARAYASAAGAVVLAAAAAASLAAYALMRRIARLPEGVA